MSSLSQSYSLSFVHSMIPHKTSSVPPAMLACRSAKSFTIRGAMIDDETFKCSTYDATKLTNGSLLSTRDISLSSSTLFREHNGRRLSTITPGTANYSSKGIGILNFLEGKCYFVTGGTGLLAKAFLEKILRVAPTTRKIFLLVKAKDEAEALRRIKTEIIECGLFKRLEEMHGENYRDFMMSKLIPVVGNLAEPGLGISNLELANRMAEEVDVIVNAAANTTLDERYDAALNLNAKGPLRIMTFAMKCKKLRLFMHVSTAFVNGERQGVVMEKPFHMGESIAQEIANASSGAQESFSVPKLDVHDEIKLATEMVKSLPKDDVAKKMKQLGLERARMFGWQNTYLLTKAMGEMMISSYKGHIPVTIIRPSIIESTYNEPFPGWMEGYRVLDPLIISYGKGLLPAHLGDPETPVDIVPLDMVVNTMVSTMAKHGSQPNSELSVYQIESGVTNPLSYQEMFGMSCDHFMTSPLMDSGGEEVRIERMKFVSSLDEFSAYIQDEVAQRMGLKDNEECTAKLYEPYMAKLKVLCKRTVGNLTHMAKVYEPYMFYKGWFDNGNARKLIGEMSVDESTMFPIDFRGVNWKNYIQNIHIPGLKKHILKGRRSVVE